MRTRLMHHGTTETGYRWALAARHCHESSLCHSGKNSSTIKCKVYEDAHIRPTSCWIISPISTAANKGSTCMTLTRCASHMRWRLVFHHASCKSMRS
ncbi:hypothetical protein M405DRAFT_302203 [Rhizopogon salebrosus TDB-379]|nr:hypothetical protein M405DRAFT_302203 [Rhizopogon salebrosus TDB-379]